MIILFLIFAELISLLPGTGPAGGDSACDLVVSRSTGSAAFPLSSAQGQESNSFDSLQFLSLSFAF